MASEYGYQQGGGFSPGYGGYGAAMDPATMRARLAMAMLERGSDSSPIRSPWQGAARMSNALFGALMMRQMQDAQSSSWQKALAGMPTGSGLMGGGGVSGGEGSPGLPAQPGALADLANDPDVMRGIANAGTNGLPDSATIGSSLQQGDFPPQMGPSLPAMAPNNSAGGAMLPGYIGGSSAPGGSNSGGPPPANMTAALPASMQHNMMVAGPGAPPLPPSGPASGNGPQGAGAGAFNPQDLAMFQQDMQAVPGTPAGAGTAGGDRSGGGILDQLKANIARTESGGNYSAVNKDSGALGKYQVMPNNVGSWTQEILGQSMTPQQFLANPQAQEMVATGKLGQYAQQYGPAGAAHMWFTGRPASNAADANGMTGNRYAALATQGIGAGGPTMAFNDGAAGPGGDLAAPPGGPPGSMQPNMMVAGPGAPSTGNRYTGMNAPMPPPGALGPPPGAGSGGNPLAGIGSGLQNMFGLANPSGPQGGNGPPPAGGGAGGQAIDPRMRQLMEVISDPYAAPGAKQVAMQFLQYYMPHPTEWRTNPGTNDQQGYNWMGQPIQGQFRPGPHETSVQKIGTDMLGQEQYGVFDKNTGQLIRRIDANGQGGESAGSPPPPSPTGSSVTAIPPGAPNSVPSGNIPPSNPAWTPGAQGLPPPPGAAGISAAPQAQAQYPTSQQWGLTLDQRQGALINNPPPGGFLSHLPAGLRPAILGNARAIVEGQQTAPVGGTAGAAKGVNEATMEAVHALDPSWTANRFDTVKQFAEGTNPNSPGGLIGTGRAALAHLAGAAQASDMLSAGQSNIPVIGPLLNKFNNLGQQDYESQYDAKIKLASQELTKYYLGAEGSKDERTEALLGQLNGAATPDQRRSYIKGLADQLNDKLNVQQERWHAGVGGMPDYQLLTPQDQEHLAYIQNMGGRTGQGQPAPNPGAGSAQAAPRGFAHQGTAGGPVIIQSDDDYNRLPSGAKFIGPDGKTRAKP